MLIFLTSCTNIKTWNDVEKENRNFSGKLEFEFLDSNWNSYLTNIQYSNPELDVYQKDIAKKFLSMQLGRFAACNYYRWQLDEAQKDKKRLKIFITTRDYALALDKKFKKAFGKSTRFEMYYWGKNPNQ